MKLVFVIAALFFSGKPSTASDCVSKLTDAFAGNERYWSMGTK